MKRLITSTFRLVFRWTFSLLFCWETASASHFFAKKFEGWHWYEQKREEEEQLKSNQQVNPSEQIQVMRVQAESLLHQAIIEPTTQNITAYLQMQRLILDKSEQFANRYQQVLYLYPELDEANKYPTAQIASHVYHAQKDKDKEVRLKALSSTHGLFYFYRTDCAYCNAFGPLVKRFATRYGFNLIPITLNQQISADFPNTQFNIDIAQKLQIKSIPALFAVNTQTKEILPLASTLTAISDIEDRAYFLSVMGGRHE